MGRRQLLTFASPRRQALGRPRELSPDSTRRRPPGRRREAESGCRRHCENSWGDGANRAWPRRAEDDVSQGRVPDVPGRPLTAVLPPLQDLTSRVVRVEATTVAFRLDGARVVCRRARVPTTAIRGD